MTRAMRLVALALVIFCAGVGTAAAGLSGDNSPGALTAAGEPALVTTYPVTGKPLYVAVAPPSATTQQIWFTVPASDQVGRLTIDRATGLTQELTYTQATTGSYPYRIVYGGGAVWFTELQGNRVGRIDPATLQLHEFPVPTAGSRPAGIDVLDEAGTTAVWFAERQGGKLARLSCASGTTTCQPIDEFALPQTAPWTGAAPEGVAIRNADDIWLAAPGAHGFGAYYPSRARFAWAGTVGTGQPWSIKADSRGYMWFTDPPGNRLGQFFPETNNFTYWYPMAGASRWPVDLVMDHDTAWFSEQAGSRLGRARQKTGMAGEYLIANSAPTGVARSADGDIWAADNSQGQLIRWSPPYFRMVYLPILVRNYQ